MTDWSRGYPVDSPYALSYQPAQSPALVALACAVAGVHWRPAPRMTALDIGCGRGLNTLVLAAANPGWTALGLDYNPAHIAEAGDLADAAGLPNAGFVEADLADMTDAELDRLPECDLITIHGVWSWVADPVRAGIVRLLTRRLKPGGACYVSYNCLPGFGPDAALQRLVRALAALESRGSSTQRAGAAVARLRGLAAEAGGVAALGLPETGFLKRLLEDDGALDPAYVAHEFLTEHWRPVFHADLCAALAPAKLGFAAAAALHENFPAMVFRDAQLPLHDLLPEGPAREFAKDLCTNRPFRRDVFVRGPRRADRDAALDGTVLAAIGPLPEEPPRLAVPSGAAELPAAMWAPMRAALEEGPQPIGRLRALVDGPRPNPAELATVLVPGLALPAPRAAGPNEAGRRLNRAVAGVAAPGGATFALAAPPLGAGLPCSWLELQVAASEEVGRRGVAAADPATVANGLLSATETEAKRAELTDGVARLLRERGPVWVRFGAAEA